MVLDIGNYNLKPGPRAPVGLQAPRSAGGQHGFWEKASRAPLRGQFLKLAACISSAQLLQTPFSRMRVGLSVRRMAGRTPSPGARVVRRGKSSLNHGGEKLHAVIECVFFPRYAA